MRRYRIAISLVCAVICLVGLVLIWGTPSSTPVGITCVARDATCVQLPRITGANLNGEEYTFPMGFTHKYQLVVMPFDRDQQMKVLDFVPLFQELTASRPDLGYYSLAALNDVAAPIRLLISGGMTAAVTDPAVKKAAFIFYLEDQKAFLQALGVPDKEAIRVFVLDQAGSVLWQASGDFTPELAEQIRYAISTLQQS